MNSILYFCTVAIERVAINVSKYAMLAIQKPAYLRTGNPYLALRLEPMAEEKRSIDPGTIALDAGDAASSKIEAFRVGVANSEGA